ncbi:MAG: Crp/Fnr family transcriptional regulator [Actinobacteria bacterium]|nr:Crp/Fnr family transcriptional regulator [Actinomycetota bacterium]
MESENKFPDSLSETAAFKGLGEAERAQIYNYGERRIHKPEAVLFREGEPALRLYLVVEGGLKLTKLHEEGKETVVRYIRPGDFTAAAAVFSEKKYPATAKAVSSTEVVSWDQPAMWRILNDYPRFTVNLLQVAVERLDEIQNRLLELQVEKVEQRLARALLRLMEQSGKRTDEGILINFRLTRQELADYTGTTLYTVSRTLSGWEKKGWISSGREKIVVTDPHALVAFSEAGS